MKPRYYLIDQNGRGLMKATTDEEAFAEAKATEERYHFVKLKRIVKETKETIWEAGK